MRPARQRRRLGVASALDPANRDDAVWRFKLKMGEKRRPFEAQGKQAAPLPRSTTFSRQPTGRRGCGWVWLSADSRPLGFLWLVPLRRRNPRAQGLLAR